MALAVDLSWIPRSRRVRTNPPETTAPVGRGCQSLGRRRLCRAGRRSTPLRRRLPGQCPLLRSCSGPHPQGRSLQETPCRDRTPAESGGSGHPAITRAPPAPGRSETRAMAARHGPAIERTRSAADWIRRDTLSGSSSVAGRPHRPLGESAGSTPEPVPGTLRRFPTSIYDASGHPPVGSLRRPFVEPSFPALLL